MKLDEKTGVNDLAAVHGASCSHSGHIWGDPYTFGGVAWYRDCVRCFEGEEISAPGSADSGVFPLDGNVVQLAKTGSGH